MHRLAAALLLAALAGCVVPVDDDDSAAICAGHEPEPPAADFEVIGCVEAVCRGASRAGVFSNGYTELRCAWDCAEWGDTVGRVELTLVREDAPGFCFALWGDVAVTPVPGCE